MIRKISIIRNGGGELANQLWNYVSAYAYGLESSAKVRNPSFFEYHSFFNFLPRESLGTKALSLFFRTPRRRSHPLNRIGRKAYTAWAKLIEKTAPASVYSSQNSENRTTNLPPTAPLPDRFSDCGTLRLSGWLFRNSNGLLRFAPELRAAFSPKAAIANRVDSIVAPLRASCKKLIGIHIRQSDYAGFKGGSLAIPQSRVREIIDEYAREFGIDANQTIFLIASDGPIDAAAFSGLNTYVSKETSVTDLFLLARTDAIIGSDSSFGAFAAWHADVPHVVCKKEPIDWLYYRAHTAFFENKYSTMVHY